MLRLTTSKMNFLCLLVALALVALPAFAQTSPGDQILLLLKKHGYNIVLHERTWLGRGRVLASKDGVQRELVFNPGTGEIMRDYMVSSTPNADTVPESGLAAAITSATTGEGTTPLATEQLSSPAAAPSISLDWSPTGPAAIVGTGQ